MGADAFEVSVNLVKLILIFLVMVQMVPILVWIERRGFVLIQNKFGPNRVSPLGFTQVLADAVKFIFKEELVPQKGRALIYHVAPIAALVPGALALGSIPFSIPIQLEAFNLSLPFFGDLGSFGPYVFQMQSFEVSAGIVFVLGMSSLGTYSLLMAGWGSSSRHSLMGAFRASVQMISYELVLALSLVGCLLIYGTFSFNEISSAQAGGLVFNFMGKSYGAFSFLPNWGVFYQPLGAVLFFAATFAQCNRLPFDLPVADADLMAGFRAEYGGFKMFLFLMGKYGHMLVSSSLLVIFYFGGHHVPIHWVTEEVVNSWALGLVGSAGAASILTSLIFLFSFLAKVIFFLGVFVWVRWTLPRFKYNRLMDLGWKKILPWALGNMVVTAVLLLIASL